MFEPDAITVEVTSAAGKFTYTIWRCPPPGKGQRKIITFVTGFSSHDAALHAGEERARKGRC